MARVRSSRRTKKKPKTTIVSPDGLVYAESDANHHLSDTESVELAERLEFSSDDRRKVRQTVDNIDKADEADVAVGDAINMASIPNNNLFGTSQLYAVAKPAILSLQSKVQDIVSAGDNWGILRTTQFLEHVFHRTKKNCSISQRQLLD